ncbi:Clp protease ClpP [Bacillaceae bacterium IKA-2]|nr:Clp protease ClpP [Bacillaceae bacterium IKA-2]
MIKNNIRNLLNKIRMGKMTMTATKKTTNNKKSWEMKNLSETKAEILIYGDIEEYRWMEEDVTAYNFAKELKNLGDVSEIDIRINSGGGSVYAATAIHSQIKAHKAFVTAYIDGLAASAASYIPMAADVIKIPANGMMMVHNPMTIAIGNEKDFEKAISTLGKVKDTIIAAYQAKTGLSYDEISQMMDDETWLTGAEAVEKGFADELLYSVDIVASLKGKHLMVNSVKHDLSDFKKLPTLADDQQDSTNSFKDMLSEFFNMFKNSEGNFSVKEAKNVNNEEEEELKTVEEFKNKYPDLYNQAIKDVTKAENARIQEIDEYTEPGFENIMKEAKEDPTMTVQDAVMKQMKAMQEARKNQQKDAQNKGKDYLENRNQDAADLGGIEGGSAPEVNLTEQEEINAHAKMMSDAVNKNRGGVK